MWRRRAPSFSLNPTTNIVNSSIAQTCFRVYTYSNRATLTVLYGSWPIIGTPASSLIIAYHRLPSSHRPFVLRASLQMLSLRHALE